METNRLLLRPWREEDGMELQRLFDDPAVRGGRHLPPDRIARLAEGSLRQWRVNGFGPWAAIDKTTGSWIGRVGLDELDDWPGIDKIEVGFELHTAWWGRGLATEGARAALEFGFEQHGLQCIISVTAAAHAAARRVMEKAGLTYRGTRAWLSPDVPVVWYAIDRDAWKPGKSAEGRTVQVAVVGIDHVQLAMPEGGESEARAFYSGLLGIPEVPKPPTLALRGGAWFEDGDVKVHLGVDSEFRPARKAHPGLLVHDVAVLVDRLRAAGYKVVDDDPLEGYYRVYVSDPFGNRLELLERRS